MTRRGAYDPAHDPLYSGLADEPAGKPAKPARTGQRRPFEPSMEDRARAAEMSAKGLMQPHRSPCKPGFNPRRGRWGEAIENWTEAGNPPVPPEKP
jgi:hypothetical protein